MTTDGPVLPSLDAAHLQFDAPQSETAPQALSCSICIQPIRAVYYETAGQLVCARCRGKLESQIGSAGKSGRLMRAFGLGLLAAAAGSAVYYGVAAALGQPWGIVAILVGVGVGKAVFTGSGRRGGRGYQLMAVGFTYFAVASSYIPIARDQIRKDAKLAQSDSAVTFADKIAANDSAAAETDTATMVKAPAATSQKAERGGLRGGVLLVVGLVLLSAVLPILMGLGNPITLLLLVFGLMQAWRLNKQVEVAVTGPYRLAQTPVEA